MTTGSKQQRSSSIPGELLDLIPAIELLPGENTEDYKALEQTFIGELNPGSALEFTIVKRLVANEWEQHRSDTLRADITRARLRNAVLEALLEAHDSAFLESKHRKTADGIVSDNAAHRKKASEDLAKSNITLSDVRARAYLSTFREFEALERRADVFDGRRRDLMADLRSLQARRQQSQVEDAQLVDTGDN